VTAPQTCHVYKSLRRADTYVYLAAPDAGAALPAALRAELVPLEFVLALDLSKPRRLAREDFAVVRANVAQVGFHLQRPPPRLVAFGTALDTTIGMPDAAAHDRSTHG